MMFRSIALISLISLLAACQASAPEPQVRRDTPTPAPTALDTAASDVCWSTDRVPAVTETVFEPGGVDGARVAREVVVQPAEDRLFSVPCPEHLFDGFTATLQRALSARGLYTGPVSGTYDAATAAAVRQFQAPQGLNSGTLSLQAAQQLGLVAIPRDQL